MFAIGRRAESSIKHGGVWNPRTLREAGSLTCKTKKGMGLKMEK